MKNTQKQIELELELELAGVLQELGFQIDIEELGFGTAIHDIIGLAGNVNALQKDYA